MNAVENECRPEAEGEEPAPSELATLYLDTMERILVGEIYEDPAADPWHENRFDPAARSLGRDWPLRAHTMIGTRRLHNLRELCELALRNHVAGDFIETGAWRGGACIMMRAVLAAYGVRDRKVFVADSFAGLPEPDAANYPADAGDTHHRFAELAVTLKEVQDNFRRYGLLDEQVVFVKGWFKDTLPNLPARPLAILRLDGDMYESTMQALTSLYDRLSHGGYCIVDDGNVPNCKAAIDDFREQRRIEAAIVDIDGWGFYWQKP